MIATHQILLQVNYANVVGERVERQVSRRLILKHSKEAFQRQRVSISHVLWFRISVTIPSQDLRPEDFVHYKVVVGSVCEA